MGGAVILGALITGATTWWVTGSLIAGVVMAGLTLLTGLFSPKPQTIDMKPASLSDFSVTQANEGQSIPVVYGRVKIPGNIIYYGNLITEAVTEEVETGGKGGGGSTTVTRGYNYYLDIWQAICMGKVTLEKAFVDNDESKAVSASNTIWNDGTMDTYPNLQYASKLPGVAHIFWKKFFVGFNRTFVPTVYFWVKRELNTGLGYDDVYDDSENYVGNNPACVIWDLLTNFAKVEGQYLDTNSFVSAAEYFYNEGIGINYVISSSRKVKDVVKEICDLVSAQLEYNNEGKISLRILKNDDTAVGVIEDDFIEFNFSKPTWNSVPNEFRANYVENGTVRTIILENPAAKLISGKNIQVNYDLTAISSRSLALKLLTSLMKKESFPKSSLDIVVPIKYAKYTIGDIITIKNSDVGLEGDFRIVSISEPKFDSNEVHIKLIQHTEKLFDNYYTDTGGTQWVEPSYDLPPFQKIKVIELDYNETTKTTPTFLLLVAREKGYETGFAVYLSFTGTDYKYMGTFTTFATNGTLVNDYPDTTYEIDDTVGIIYTPYTSFDNDWDTISRTDLFTTNRVIVIDNEIMTFQNFEPYETTNYKITGIIRNVNWSGKAYHNAGTDIYITKISDNILTGVNLSSPFYLKIVPVLNNKIGSIEDATPIYVEPTMKAKRPITPEKVIATRDNSNPANVNVDVFVVSKTNGIGAGKNNPDTTTDQYPFEYEGIIVAQINDEPEMYFDSPNFTIENRPEAFTLKIKTRWNGFDSNVITVNVPNSGNNSGNTIPYWYEP